jgi:uncharacterized protein (DUF3084 family)
MRWTWGCESSLYEGERSFVITNDTPRSTPASKERRPGTPACRASARVEDGAPGYVGMGIRFQWQPRRTANHASERMMEPMMPTISTGPRVLGVVLAASWEFWWGASGL